MRTAQMGRSREAVTAYVDSSALLKRYLEEPDSDEAQQVMDEAGGLVTSRLTTIEVRKGLGRIASPMERGLARKVFASDLAGLYIVEIDASICDLAAELTESLKLRSLDAIHVASALMALGGNSKFITFDERQARAASAKGLHVLGTSVQVASAVDPA